jgi:hypothetical protein
MHIAIDTEMDTAMETDMNMDRGTDIDTDMNMDTNLQRQCWVRTLPYWIFSTVGICFVYYHKTIIFIQKPFLKNWLEGGINDIPLSCRSCSETTITGESWFHVSTPPGPS